MTSVVTSTVGSYKIELKYLCDKNGLAGPPMLANSPLRKPRQKGMELKGNLGHTVKPLPQKLAVEEGGRRGRRRRRLGILSARVQSWWRSKRTLTTVGTDHE